MNESDRRDLLDTEARIIAEDERYAVVAVRIEKVALARNLKLLGALCDLVPAGRRKTRETTRGA